MATPAAVPFAAVTDPLTLGSMVQCIDAGAFGGWEVGLRGDIKNSVGQPKQTSFRGLVKKATVVYNPLAAMSWANGSLSIDSELVCYPFQTVATNYIVVAARPSKDNGKEDSFTVDVEHQVAATKDHLW